MRFVEVLNDVTDVIWDKNDSSPRQKFYYTIFMKLQFILDGIHFQVLNLDGKRHYGLSAGLSLRTCMLDVLNLYYVMDVHEDQEEAELRINSIMADHLKYTLSELKPVEKDDVVKRWPELFDEDQKLKNFQRLGTKTFINGISTFNTLIQETKEAHHLYKIFSKYEHNGAFTFDLLHNPYSEKGNDVVKYMIYSAIGVCALACKLVASNWIDNNMPLMERLDTSIKELLN